MLSFVTAITSSSTRRDVDLAVVERLRWRRRACACASFTASSAALLGEALERLVDRHRLRAGDDALAGGEIGVLAGDEHSCRRALPRSAPGWRRRRCRRSRRGRRRSRAPALVMAALAIFLAFSGFQSSAQSSCTTSMSPRSMSGLRTLSWPCLKSARVVVGLRAVDADDACPCRASASWSTRYCACSSPTFTLSKREVEIEVAVADEPVVGDAPGCPPACAIVDRLGHRRAVVRDDDEHVDAVA